jgi:transcriptional regulator with GAF, ATPase, and Fis domain
MQLNFNLLTENELQAIYKLNRILAETTDENRVLEMLLTELIPFVGAEIGAFIYYNQETGQTTPGIVLGEDSRRRNGSFSSTALKKVIASESAVLVFDTSEDASFSASQSVEINRIEAILAFPLMVNSRLYGIMYFDSRKQRQKFTEITRQFLEFFAPIASLALENILRTTEMEKENILLRSSIPNTIEHPYIIGKSPGIQKILNLLPKIANSDASVIITGENGSGKDLVARAIHEQSSRKNLPFVAQYIGNIPQSILESELFGHAKGSFTGAVKDKIGLFEAVNGGTLFLDEIGDFPIELQASLLRVLQNREIFRVGEHHPRKVDFRLITATNKNLTEMVKQKKFREDLYYRLNVVNINIPPLRERIEDIPLLAQHFIEQSEEGASKTLSREAERKLAAYRWPGNVRQLQNIIQRALIFSTGNTITPDDILLDEPEEDIFNGTLEEYKNKLIRERLALYGGNRTKTAESLGVSLRYLQNKVKELNL